MGMRPGQCLRVPGSSWLSVLGLLVYCHHPESPNFVLNLCFISVFQNCSGSCTKTRTKQEYLLFPAISFCNRAPNIPIAQDCSELTVHGGARWLEEAIGKHSMFLAEEIRCYSSPQCTSISEETLPKPFSSCSSHGLDNQPQLPKIANVRKRIDRAAHHFFSF